MPARPGWRIFSPTDYVLTMNKFCKRLSAWQAEHEACALDECEKMLAALQAVAIPGEPNPVKVKWFG
jgi:hypothetical protein